MKEFQNKATLSFNGRITNSNVTTGEIIDAVSATKTAIVDTYSPNENVAFIISIVNKSPAPMTNVIITDDLGTASSYDGKYTPLSYVNGSVKYYINGILQQTPPKVEVQTNSFTIQNLFIPPMGNTEIAYETVVNEFAPASVRNKITNKANILYNELRGGIQVEETIQVKEASKLTISKSLSPEHITEDSIVTYTFILQNSGNISTENDRVIITDTFDPALDSIYVTLDGKPLTLDTDYTYSPETGEFSTEKTNIVVPEATYSRNSDGVIVTDPGVAVVKVTGKLNRRV